MTPLQLLRRLRRPQPAASYAQSGEDLIVQYILNVIGVSRPFYVDIGAYHPYHLNNTARFYERGAQGINIEADPDLFKAFPRRRRRDINLNLGVSDHKGHADFYLMEPSTLNTFSRAEAERLVQAQWARIRKVSRLPIDTLDGVMGRYAQGRQIDFLSIDVEGMDSVILASLAYNDLAPAVICVETIPYAPAGQERKDTEIIDFLKARGYLLYADTYINTIFVRRDRWAR